MRAGNADRQTGRWNRAIHGRRAASRRHGSAEGSVGLPYSDAGLDYYSNGLVASDAMIEANPGLVRRFVRATLDGLKSAMADPRQAGEIMHKHHREIDVDIAIGETIKVKELCGSAGCRSVR